VNCIRGSQGQQLIASEARGQGWRTNLDRVSDQVGDDLPEPEWVSGELVGDPRIDIVDEVELVLGGLDAEGLEHAKDAGSE
jgi:hypothetical protein